MRPGVQASTHECLHGWRKLAFQMKEKDAVTEFFHRPIVFLEGGIITWAYACSKVQEVPR
jgi:hypothetical protein